MNLRYILKTNILILFTLGISIYKSNAQQLPHYTSISINPYMVNPAVAGTEDFIHLQAGYRSQWTNFEDAPQTTYFSGHTTLSKRVLNQNYTRTANASRTSLGLVLVKDQTGPLSQSKAEASFAYNFALTPEGWRLSIGLNAGFQGFAYRPDGYTEKLLDQDDPTISAAINKDLLSLAGGFWLYNDHLFVGASSFQLFNSNYDGFGNNSDVVPNTSFLRHYFYMAGFKANLGPDVFLTPAILIKSVNGAPISYDLNAKLVISDKYWLGGNYRKEDSFAAFGGFLIKNKLELTYSFDLVLSKIRNTSAGGHEIHLGYRIFPFPEVVCPSSRFW